MALIKAITKHGNSPGLILEQAILKVVGWDVGTGSRHPRKGRFNCPEAPSHLLPPLD
jgi:hypothetical protein